jgi:hypothetical protein
VLCWPQRPTLQAFFDLRGDRKQSIRAVSIDPAPLGERN